MTSAAERRYTRTATHRRALARRAWRTIINIIALASVGVWIAALARAWSISP